MISHPVREPEPVAEREEVLIETAANMSEEGGAIAPVPVFEEAESAPEPDGAVKPGKPGRLARSTAFFSVATAASRIAGLAREVVAAGYFGITGPMSAFICQPTAPASQQ